MSLTRSVASVMTGKAAACKKWTAEISSSGLVAMQGFGVRLDPSQAGTPAFGEAIMEVLSNPQYTEAAQAMSVKIRARKNTPAQEAAGKSTLQRAMLADRPEASVSNAGVASEIYMRKWALVEFGVFTRDCETLRESLSVPFTP